MSLPEFVDKAMKAYLACGQLANGFARFRCADCRKDVLVAFSCKVRGLCPSPLSPTCGSFAALTVGAPCDGKRMIERAPRARMDKSPPAGRFEWDGTYHNGHPPRDSLSQWVFTLPFDFRYVLAWNADLRNAVHQALMRAIAKHYLRDARSQGLAGQVQGAAISAEPGVAVERSDSP